MSGNGAEINRLTKITNSLQKEVDSLKERMLELEEFVQNYTHKQIRPDPNPFGLDGYYE